MQKCSWLRPSASSSHSDEVRTGPTQGLSRQHFSCCQQRVGADTSIAGGVCLPFATDFTSVGPRILHYGTGQQCAVVQKPLNPRRKVGGEKSKAPLGVNHRSAVSQYQQVRRATQATPQSSTCVALRASCLFGATVPVAHATGRDCFGLRPDRSGHRFDLFMPPA